MVVQLLVNVASAQAAATAGAAQDDADLIRMVRMKAAPTWWKRLTEDDSSFAPGAFKPMQKNIVAAGRRVQLRGGWTTAGWVVADVVLFVCLPFLGPPLLSAALYKSRSKESTRRGDTLSLGVHAGYVRSNGLGSVSLGLACGTRCDRATLCVLRKQRWASSIGHTRYVGRGLIFYFFGWGSLH